MEKKRKEKKTRARRPGERIRKILPFVPGGRRGGKRRESGVVHIRKGASPAPFAKEGKVQQSKGRRLILPVPSKCNKGKEGKGGKQ